MTPNQKPESPTSSEWLCTIWTFFWLRKYVQCLSILEMKTLTPIRYRHIQDECHSQTQTQTQTTLLEWRSPQWLLISWKHLFWKGPSLLYFKAGRVGRQFQCRYPYLKCRSNCYRGLLWASVLYAILDLCKNRALQQFQSFSENDTSLWSSLSVNPSLKYIQVKGLFITNPSYPSGTIRNHYGRDHSKKVGCSCVSEEHSVVCYEIHLGPVLSSPKYICKILDTDKRAWV